MFKYIVDMIVSLFHGDTIDSVMSSFDKKINRLNEIISRNNVQVVRNGISIEQLQAENSMLEYDSSRAANIVDRLEQLVAKDIGLSD